MSQKAKVLKRMVVDGKVIEPNEIVDVSEWRNAKALEGSRYITFITHVSESPKETPKEKLKTKTLKAEDAE